VIGRGDRNGIEGRVVEQPADIGDGSRAASDLRAALVEHRVVDVTEAGNLDIRHPRKGVQVILPATIETTDRDADAIVGPEDALGPGQERDAAQRTRARRRLCRRLEKIPPRDI
jgi:hypothetical protein